MRTGGLKIGKVFGIEVWLDYSWFILFFLIGLVFTAGLLPAQFPEFSGVALLIAGAVITVLFFVSILLHELSHSIYAKRQGLEVRRITLFVFGGVSEVLDDPRHPRQEFLLAGIGPLSSFLISAAFGAIWIIGEQFAASGLIAVGSILCLVNLALAIFNILPGFPMDGGRMLRAVIWKATGSMERATRYAATTGKVLSFVLIAYGVLQLLLIGLISGLWLILIGIFLNQAASYSYRQTVYRMILKDVKVEDLMDRHFVSATWGTTIKNFFQKYVLKHKETTVPLEPDKKHPAGLVDAKYLPEESDGEIGQFALANGYTLAPEDSAIKAFDIMNQSGLEKLPVSKDGKLVGVLTLEKLTAYIIGRHKAAQYERKS